MPGSSHTGPPAVDSQVPDRAASQPAAGASTSTRRKSPPPDRRPWFIDDIVVIVFALFGFAGGVFLPHLFAMPPITTSFLLATGMAALVYRFLGGIQGASLTVGSLKLGGGLAALVGIAMLINHAMVAETTPPPTTASATPAHRAYHVTGQVVDSNGSPVSNLAITDFVVSPPGINPGPGGKFAVTFANGLDFNNQPQFPTLSISHSGLSSDTIALKPATPNDLEIPLGTVRLHAAAGSAAPSAARTPGTARSLPMDASLTPAPEREP
jgi:hypothetical protein